MSTWLSVLAIVGLAVITLVSRSFFLLPDRDVPIPNWLREGLRYAPLAALVAVVAPEVLMTNGELINTWKDARVFAAAVGVVSYVWRGSILLTIGAGTGTLLLLRFALGW